MSRAYRVPVYEASATVEAEDHLSMDLAMLDILSPEDMKALLREELRAGGWRDGQDGELTTQIEGASASLDKDTTTVIVENKERQTVRVRTRNKGALDAQLEKAKEARKESVERGVVRELLRAEPAVREQVQAALQRVYVRALRQKAESMGDVESIDEQRGESGELELTIKIKV